MSREESDSPAPRATGHQKPSVSKARKFKRESLLQQIDSLHSINAELLTHADPSNEEMLKELVNNQTGIVRLKDELDEMDKVKPKKREVGAFNQPTQPLRPTIRIVDFSQRRSVQTEVDASSITMRLPEPQRPPVQIVDFSQRGSVQTEVNPSSISTAQEPQRPPVQIMDFSQRTSFQTDVNPSSVVKLPEYPVQVLDFSIQTNVHPPSLITLQEPQLPSAQIVDFSQVQRMTPSTSLLSSTGTNISGITSNHLNNLSFAAVNSSMVSHSSSSFSIVSTPPAPNVQAVSISVPSEPQTDNRLRSLSFEELQIYFCTTEAKFLDFIKICPHLSSQQLSFIFDRRRRFLQDAAEHGEINAQNLFRLAWATFHSQFQELFSIGNFVPE
jgi:hypothetical protein